MELKQTAGQLPSMTRQTSQTGVPLRSTKSSEVKLPEWVCVRPRVRCVTFLACEVKFQASLCSFFSLLVLTLSLRSHSSAFSFAHFYHIHFISHTNQKKNPFNKGHYAYMRKQPVHFSLPLSFASPATTIPSAFLCGWLLRALV